MLLWGLFATSALAQQPAAAPAPPPLLPLGTAPPAAQQPHLEFVFEERVTLSPAVVLGDTAFGHRQYIPITGGTIAGPKLKGEVIPGGWDFQLGLANGCRTLTADYFIRAEDGTVIHILNQGTMCPGQRGFFRPTFEAPKGPHDWLTGGTFVVTLELDTTGATPAQGGGPPQLGAIRLKFYQVK